MAACATHGHLFGSDDRCMICGDPAPPVPAFLRRAREPDARDTELARLREQITAMDVRFAECMRLAVDLRAKLETVERDAAFHAVAWRALGYVLGKFPELSQVIFNEFQLHNAIIGNDEGVWR